MGVRVPKTHRALEPLTPCPNDLPSPSITALEIVSNWQPLTLPLSNYSQISRQYPSLPG